jgi:hypothetical protein
MKLWDKMLPQALNLLRHSKINPCMLAHVQLEGNRAPMYPSGLCVIAHDKPKQRSTWDAHGQDGWCIGPSPEH